MAFDLQLRRVVAAHASTSSSPVRSRLWKRVPGSAARLLAVAVFDHAPVFQDHDLVGAVQGAQPVGDDDGGAVVQQLVDGALDQLLGGRVQARGGLIQDHQPGVAQEDAGKGQQLGLAGGEAAPAGFQLGIQAVGQRLPASPSSPSSSITSRMRLSGMLRSKKVMLSRTLAWKSCTSWVTSATRSRRACSCGSGQRDAAQADLPLGGVVQAEDQPRQGGFAGAGAAQQAQSPCPASA